jgi:hypothetical protein
MPARAETTRGSRRPRAQTLRCGYQRCDPDAEAVSGRGLGAVYCVHYLHDHFLQGEREKAVGVFAADRDLGEHQRYAITPVGDGCA